MNLRKCAFYFAGLQVVREIEELLSEKEGKELEDFVNNLINCIEKSKK